MKYIAIYLIAVNIWAFVCFTGQTNEGRENRKDVFRKGLCYRLQLLAEA